MSLVLNLLLGFVPALILGASIAAGVEDDAAHRRVFLLVYGLWAFTLAGWNWLESAHPAWIVVWIAFGIGAFVLRAMGKRTP
jgi:biotin transporter BioY